MELITTGAVEKFVVKTLTKKFGKSVIERWTRYRAMCFLSSFIEEVSKEIGYGEESAKVDKLLDDIVNDDTKSEVLFDSYRRVCFSKSRDLGPRIIAYLTAKLVLGGRMATEGEEKIFQAAETLGDGEFYSFYKAYSEYSLKSSTQQFQSTIYRENGDLVIVWRQETTDTIAPFARDIEIGPLNFGLAMGIWAVKLQSCDLLFTRLTKGMDGIKEAYQWRIIFSSPCQELHDLVLRSIPSSGKGKEPV